MSISNNIRFDFKTHLFENIESYLPVKVFVDQHTTL